MRLNELDKKSRVTVFVGNFANHAYLNSYWVIVFGKYFWLVELVHVKYSFHELLIIFWLTLVNNFYLKFAFSLHVRNTSRKCILQRKKWWNKHKEHHIFIYLRCWRSKILFLKFIVKNSLSVLFFPFHKPLPFKLWKKQKGIPMQSQRSEPRYIYKETPLL